MSDAPERIWTYSPIWEHGMYHPEAVEAEGKYGGYAVEYVRADIHADLIAKADALAKALEPFSFRDPDNQESTTQDAWEIIYRDMVKDWVDFDDIEKARAALNDYTQAREK